MFTDMRNHAGEGHNKGKIANVEELRQRIVDEWERLDPVSYTHLTLPTILRV